MNLKEIQELVKIINKSNVAEISIEQKDFKITLKAKVDASDSSRTEVVHQPISIPVQPSAPTQPLPAAPAPEPPAPAPSPPPAKEADNDNNLITITSPMIGTFYRSPGPDKDPFIKVGDTIQQGDVVCIIEAMKLFNEIEAEVSGKVVKILAENSTPVEYDQPLLLIDPS